MPLRPRLSRRLAAAAGLVLLAAVCLVPSRLARRPAPTASPSTLAPAAESNPAPSRIPTPTTRIVPAVSPPPAPAPSPSPTVVPTPDVAPLLEKIRAFDAWLLALHRGENPPVASGPLLARDRRAALKQLIALDPRAALAAAFPLALRSQLPADAVAELETPIDAFGRFHVSVTCFGDRHDVITRTAEIETRRYTAHVFGRRRATLSKERLPLHGFAIDDQLALAEEPFRVLEPGERGVDPSEAREIRVAIGSEVRAFATPAEFDAWRARATATESVPDPAAALVVPDGIVTAAAPPPNWTFGEKTVLWIRAEFPDDPGSPASDAEINATMADVDTFYRDVSGGRCSLRTIILPVVLPITRSKAAFLKNEFSYYDLQMEAVALAKSYDAANGNLGTYNPDRADRYIVVCKSVPSFGFLGIASVGGKGCVLNGTVASDVTAHELGHNHGLHHAHAWQPTGSSPIGSGFHDSYGDPFDDMGNLARVPAGHFNAKQKENLLYLAADQVLNVTASGTYRLYRHDHRDAAGVQALKIGAGDYEFWLEHRQQLPRPGFFESGRVRHGLQFRWGRYPASLTGNGTYLLDMTPGSGARMDDAPLAVGETFTDITGGLTVTPVATGGTAPREWIDVRVSYGATGNNRNPILAASLPYTVVPARTPITFSASASDPDGDPATVRWDFADGNALRIGATLTHRFLKGGPVTVTCSAIDGRGGLTTKTFNLIVDDPLVTWTTADTGNGFVSVSSILHDGRQFIAAGSGSLLTSADGLTWTRRTAIPAMYPAMMAVAGSTYVAAGFVSTSQATGTIMASNDGLTWRNVTLPSPQPELVGVAFGAGRFVVVGKAGALLHSIDGSTWSTITPVTTRNLRDLQFANGLFVATGEDGTILTSPDGLAWNNRSIATGATISWATFHRGRWIAGNGANLWTSPDGQTWTPVPYNPAVTTTFQHPLSLGDDGLIAPGLNDTLFLSDDGLGWNSTPIATPASAASLRTVAAANGTVVLASTNGRLYTTRVRSAVASPPQIAAAPQSQLVPIGQDVSFTAGPATIGTTYQWARNGEPIAGATNPTLTLRNPQPADNGSYTLALTNFSGQVTSPPATLVVDANTARIINLSIRSRAGAGSDIFTVGFVVAPSYYSGASRTALKSLLTRGIGPALTTFGVSGALADPRIDFFDGTVRIGGNDDWSLGTTAPATLSTTFRNVGAFDLTPGSKDAVLLTTFAPKAYTVQLTGPNAATGQALAELYDLDTGVMAPRLVNVSARAQIGAASDLLIGGFVISGGGERTVLIRAIGPALATFGVTGTLAQPVVTLFNGPQSLDMNSGWGTSASVVGLRAAAVRVGAFALPENSRDSALLATLPAGAYTIQVAGANSTTGVTLLEIYEVP